MKITYITSHNWSSPDLCEVIEAVQFGLNYLKLTGGRLRVKLVNKDDVLATTERIKSNRYEIRISHTATKSNQMLETVFHELVHLRQFHNKELRVQKNGWNYKGVFYLLESVEDYLLAPWEMEARAMEEVLLNAFAEY